MMNAGQAAMTDVLSAVAGEPRPPRPPVRASTEPWASRLDFFPRPPISVARRDARGTWWICRISRSPRSRASSRRFSGRLEDGVTIEVGEALGAITLGEVAQRISHGVGHAAPAPAEAGEDVDFF